MKKNLLLLSLIAVCFFSCSKSDDNPANPGGCQLSQSSVVGTYKITTLRYKAPGIPEVDGFLLLQDCEKDDLYVLNANGTLNYNDAGTACVPSGTRTSTWSLSGNTLTIESRAFTVTNFTCTSITGSKADANTPGDLLTATFTRQ